MLPTSSAKKSSLLKIVSERILSEGLNTNTQRLRLSFILLRTLSMSGEIAKELLKLKTLEDLLAKILPVCKNEKDVKLMRHYLSHLSGFLAAFSTTEEGQKILLKEKQLYDLSLFLTDTIAEILGSAGVEAASLLNILISNLMFLRNTALNRTNKLHFISN